MQDLILDRTLTPTYDEIRHYINPKARVLWDDMTSFIQERYKVKPKVTYSQCSGKPGWNVKYQKSGKALCTLYPEKDGFVALVVVSSELRSILEGMEDKLEDEVLAVVESAGLFNRTLWLMIGVYNSAVLENVKQIIYLKHPFN